MKFQPVIKWSGSKRSQSEYIVEKIIKITSGRGDIYYEPFCGGASVLMQVLLNNDKVKFNKYICSDANPTLIDLWNLIKGSPKVVSDKYFEMWEELNRDDDVERKKEYYYNIRSKFNKERNPLDFIFMLRTSVNGMCRYNQKGDFNSPFHFSRKGINPKTFQKIIFQWSEILNKYNVEFICQDYSNIKTNEDDFVYLDPPYANTKGLYYGGIELDNLWEWMELQKSVYLLSFDGKTELGDTTYNVPSNLYDEHEYISSGNSSFRRMVGVSSYIDVKESLYIKNKKEDKGV